MIRVGGHTGKVVDQSGGSTIFEVPALITPEVLTWYPLLEKVETITPAAIISDGGDNAKEAFDGQHHTKYSSTNAECYIGLDAGEGLLVNPKGIRYFPDSLWTSVVQNLKDAIIEASVDGASYTTLSTVGSDVHTGWNSFHPEITQTYRFFRIRHDSTSGCQIAEFEVSGIVYSDVAVSTDSTAVDVVLDDGASQQTLSGVLTYAKTATPVVSSIDTTTGSVKGGYDIVLTGTDLGALDITIDGVVCAVQANSATSVTCTVGERANIPSENSFKVSLNGNKAVIAQ